MVGALSAAALAVGRRAWQTGQDIETAVTLAGYSAALARGVYEYFSQHATPELEAAVSQSQEREDMAPMVKRARNYGAYSGRKVKEPPVAKPVKKYVKKCMARLLDDKWQDTVLTFTNIAAAGVVGASYFGTIQLGTGDTSRIGNNVRIQRMRITGQFSDAATGNYRMLILLDRQCNGAAATVADVLGNAAVNGAYNHNTVVGWGGSRFVVLKDLKGNLSLQVSAQNVQKRMFWQYNKDVIVRYSSNAGTVSDVVSNNLVLLFVSDTGTVDFAGELQIKFTDA